jgi:hypothetical protein
LLHERIENCRERWLIHLNRLPKLASQYKPDIGRTFERLLWVWNRVRANQWRAKEQSVVVIMEKGT